MVGAGEGAALGLLWMATECRLQRDAAADQLVQLRHILAEPEGRDLACGIWLDLSSVLGGRRLPLQKMINDVTRKGKVRTVFVSGEAAGSGRLYAEEANRGQKKKIAHARSVEGTSGCRARMLLQQSTGVSRWIIDRCLDNVLEVRGVRERRTHDREKQTFYWTFPWPGQPGARLIPAKRHGERLIHPLPIDLFLTR